ncbi:MAG: 7,8-dihydro-6-hydroxymethylpterin-pyrophosphokinase (HPPK) [Magnetococcales bacterium]|nr:7,8-dihydro-6-hydroxymethylpterin-pyrophosphokinase (HPPK) [Magnetococcales bacterium]HIJ84519.1 2-amino-4-hydroxy-6-hydroxymethyldihydropteridine diphosphokinase [Magnetococcales bacterium]
MIAGGGRVLAVVWIGIGSNLDAPVRRCCQAVTTMARHPRINLLDVSSFYRTQPVGLGRQPWFVNAVVRIATPLPPLALLRVLQRLEFRSGRNRCRETKNGPRPLDLDLLLYEQRVLRHSLLHLPHPEIPHRRFVLEPLAEISPRLPHPVLGKTIDLLLKETDDTSRVEMIASRLGWCVTGLPRR